MAMKVISPIDNAAEADALLRAGADELYGGFVPTEWKERFGPLASINQRTFAGAQIERFEDLSEIVARAHDRGCTFSLTLNAPFYDDDMLPMLLEHVAVVERIGVDGIILADLGLLRALRPLYPHMEFHASTLAHLSNSEAVKFYARQGIDRVVLPRHLPIADISHIVNAVSDVAFDAFMLVGKCPNTEGLCTFHHSAPDKIWPCEIQYSLTPLQPSASAELTAAMERQASWSRTDRRHGCGLCALPALERAGISGVKLVGRGAPPALKANNIRLVRRFMDDLQAMTDESEFRRLAREAHRKHFGAACSTNVCYYPEFYEAE